MRNRMIEGIREFQRSIFPELRTRFEMLADGQQPHTALVTCSDSRIDPHLLTGSEPGDLFVIRTAGNIVPPWGSPPSGVSASIEYAVRVLGVGEIAVCGHARCGAMDAVARPDTVEELLEIRAWIEHAEATGADVIAGGPYGSDEAKADAAARSNIALQLDHLRTYAFVRDAIDDGDLILMGWYYDFVTGRVEVYDEERRRYVEL